MRAIALLRADSTRTDPDCGSNRCRKPRKWRSSGRPTADLSGLIFRRSPLLMNPSKLAITRWPARSLATPRPSPRATVAPAFEATVELLRSTPKGEEGAELYRQLRAQKRLSAQERLKLKGLETVLEAGNADVAGSTDEMLHEAHAEELSAALDTGAVDLHPLISHTGSDAFDDIIEEMTRVSASTC